MNILLTGGIFNHSIEVQRARQSTIEIMLMNKLIEYGHNVLPLANEAKNSLDFIDKNSSFDVVHMNHMNRGTLLFALQNKIPTIYTSHDPYLASGIPIPKERMVWTLGRKIVFEFSNAIVALSNREKQELKEKFNLPENKIFVIPNGLDIDSYLTSTGRSAVPRKAKIRLLFIGQLLPFKGVDLLLKAFSQVVVETKADIELVVVSQNMTLREQLLQMANNLSILDRLSIIGPLSRQELVNELYSCDVYVHPSRGEGMSTTTMEAMACARPIIATDVGGTEELLGSNGNFLIPSEDVNSLARSIKEFYLNSEYYSVVGQKNQERVKKHFTFEQMSRRYEELYSYVSQEEYIKKENKLMLRNFYKQITQFYLRIS
jgi:glycosyltransferase involved in cell wall biosynthesis